MALHILHWLIIAQCTFFMRGHSSYAVVRSASQSMPCSVGTCVNGGLCLERPSGSKCVCPVGYYGTTCSNVTSVSYCANDTCLNGGICQETEDMDTTCVCPVVYSGPNCGNFTNPCHAKPCDQHQRCRALLHHLTIGYFCFDLRRYDNIKRIHKSGHREVLKSAKPSRHASSGQPSGHHDLSKSLNPSSHSPHHPSGGHVESDGRPHSSGNSPGHQDVLKSPKPSGLDSSHHASGHQDVLINPILSRLDSSHHASGGHVERDGRPHSSGHSSGHHDLPKKPNPSRLDSSHHPSGGPVPTRELHHGNPFLATMSLILLFMMIGICCLSIISVSRTEQRDTIGTDLSRHYNDETWRSRIWTRDNGESGEGSYLLTDIQMRELET